MERTTIGMTPDELEAYLDELLRAEATEAAGYSGRSVDEELASPGFASVRAASSYAIHLINANNAFVARFLLDRGVLPAAGDAAGSAGTEQSGPGGADGAG